MRSTLPVAADMHPSTRRRRTSHTGRRSVTNTAVEAPEVIGPELDKRSFEVLAKIFSPRWELWVSEHQAIWVDTVAVGKKPRMRFSKSLPEHILLMVSLDLVELVKVEDPKYPDTELRFVKLTNTGRETHLYGPQRGYQVVRHIPPRPGMAAERHQWGEWRRKWTEPSPTSGS